MVGVASIQIDCGASAEQKRRDRATTPATTRFDAGNSIIAIKCCFKSMIKVKYHPLKPKIDSHRKIRLKSRTCVRTNKRAISSVVVVVIKRRKMLYFCGVLMMLIYAYIFSALRSLPLICSSDRLLIIALIGGWIVCCFLFASFMLIAYFYNYRY